MSIERSGTVQIKAPATVIEDSFELTDEATFLATKAPASYTNKLVRVVLSDGTHNLYESNGATWTKKSTDGIKDGEIYFLRKREGADFRNLIAWDKDAAKLPIETQSDIEAVEVATVTDESAIAAFKTDQYQPEDRILITSGPNAGRKAVMKAGATDASDPASWEVDTTQSRAYASEADRLARTGFTPNAGETVFINTTGKQYRVIDPADSAQDVQLDASLIGVIGDFEDATEKAIAKEWKAETLDERFRGRWQPLTAIAINASASPSSRVYRYIDAATPAGVISFAALATGDLGKEIAIENDTATARTVTTGVPTLDYKGNTITQFTLAPREVLALKVVDNGGTLTLDQFAPSSGGVSSWTRVTADTTVESNAKYSASVALNYTPPAAPEPGDEIQFWNTANPISGVEQIFLAEVALPSNTTVTIPQLPIGPGYRYVLQWNGVNWNIVNDGELTLPLGNAYNGSRLLGNKTYVCDVTGAGVTFNLSAVPVGNIDLVIGLLSTEDFTVEVDGGGNIIRYQDDAGVARVASSVTVSAGVANRGDVVSFLGTVESSLTNSRWHMVIRKAKSSFVPRGTTADKIAYGNSGIEYGSLFADETLGKIQRYSAGGSGFAVVPGTSHNPSIAVWAGNAGLSGINFKITDDPDATVGLAAIDVPDGTQKQVWIIGQQQANGTVQNLTTAGTFTVRNDAGIISLVSIENERRWGNGNAYITTTYNAIANLEASPVTITDAQVKSIFQVTGGAWQNTDSSSGVDAAAAWATETEYVGPDNTQFSLVIPPTMANGPYVTNDGQTLTPGKRYNLIYSADRSAADSVAAIADDPATVAEILLMDLIGEVADPTSFAQHSKIGAKDGYTAFTEDLGDLTITDSEVILGVTPRLKASHINCAQGAGDGLLLPLGSNRISFRVRNATTDQWSIGIVATGEVFHRTLTLSTGVLTVSSAAADTGSASITVENHEVIDGEICFDLVSTSPIASTFRLGAYAVDAIAAWESDVTWLISSIAEPDALEIIRYTADGPIQDKDHRAIFETGAVNMTLSPSTENRLIQMVSEGPLTVITANGAEQFTSDQGVSTDSQLAINETFRWATIIGRSTPGWSQYIGQVGIGSTSVLPVVGYSETPITSMSLGVLTEGSYSLDVSAVAWNDLAQGIDVLISVSGSGSGVLTSLTVEHSSSAIVDAWQTMPTAFLVFSLAVSETVTIDVTPANGSNEANLKSWKLTKSS